MTVAVPTPNVLAMVRQLSPAASRRATSCPSTLARGRPPRCFGGTAVMPPAVASRESLLTVAGRG
jgi:hypothetical protein